MSANYITAIQLVECVDAELDKLDQTMLRPKIEFARSFSISGSREKRLIIEQIAFLVALSPGTQLSPAIMCRLVQIPSNLRGTQGQPALTKTSLLPKQNICIVFKVRKVVNLFNDCFVARLVSARKQGVFVFQTAVRKLHVYYD